VRTNCHIEVQALENNFPGLENSNDFGPSDTRTMDVLRDGYLWLGVLDSKVFVLSQYFSLSRTGCTYDGKAKIVLHYSVVIRKFFA
jgi:hypothetical protein